jgi:hypothetical protein
MDKQQTVGYGLTYKENLRLFGSIPKLLTHQQKRNEK